MSADLYALLARVRTSAPAEARSALDVAARYLAGGATVADLAAASERLRVAFDGARGARFLDGHEDRWRRPWDALDVPDAMRSFARAVQAVYAVEAAAVDAGPSRSAFYARAAAEG